MNIPARAQRLVDSRRTSVIGREEAFAGLYQQNAARLIAFLRFRLGSEADAEDLAAETFARAWRGLGDLGNRDAATAWLFRTARNLLTDSRRRQRPSLPLDHAAETEFPGPTPDSIASGREELQRVLRVIATLGERERDVIVLRFVAGLSHREIGRAIGTSEGNAAKLLHRATRDIRSKLAQQKIEGGS